MRLILILFGSLFLLKCTYKETVNKPVLNILFQNEIKESHNYDFTLSQSQLKESIQNQVAGDSSINQHGDCHTIVKIDLEPNLTIFIPFFGRHFTTIKPTYDSRCFFYAPLRIHVKKEGILYNDLIISKEKLTFLIKNNHKVFFDKTYEDYRIDINWDDNSSIENRRFVLKLITTELGNIYSKSAQYKFGKPINKLTPEEIKDVTQIRFMLYHSFDQSFKNPTWSPSSPPQISFE